jgi:hypothetical protein
MNRDVAPNRSPFWREEQKLRKGDFIPRVVVWWRPATIGSFVPLKLVFRSRMLACRGGVGGAKRRWRVVTELSIGESRSIAGRWRRDQAEKFILLNSGWALTR